MAAISTALRFRNRTPSDSVILLDTLADLPSIVSRTTFDSLDVSDDTITTYRKLKPGDRIESLTDSDSQYEDNRHQLTDSIDVFDSAIPVKSIRKTLFDYEDGITDAGFITDKDLLRYRQVADSISLTDGFQKSITRAEGVINSRVRFDGFEVVDSIDVVVSGIIARTLADSLVVADNDLTSVDKSVADSLDANDDSIELRIRNKLAKRGTVSEKNHDEYPPFHYIPEIQVTDDVIVSRSSITNTVVTTDNITAFFDQVIANRIEYKRTSAKIKHGIEPG